MNLQTINPYIRRVMYSTLYSPNIRTRVIWDYELIFIQSGSFLLTYAGIPYRCTPGDIILLHPGIEHSFSSLGETLTQPHIHFDLCYLPSSEQVGISFKRRDEMTPEEQRLIRPDELICDHSSPLLPIRNRETFLSIFFSVMDRYIADGMQNSIGSKQLMLSLIEIILHDACTRLLSPQSTVSPEQEIETIKCFIDHNFCNFLTLEILQKQFFYSRTYIEKHFKTKYGVPIMQYYRMLRMEYARTLLVDHTVTQTAEILSFSSIYAFSRAFRQYHKLSPSASRSASSSPKHKI